MQTLRVVEALDPVNQIESSLRSRCISHSIDPLDFQRLEEALHRRIVPAVALATHRLHHPIFGDQLPVFVAAYWTAAIGMHDQSRRPACVANTPSSARRRPTRAFIRSLIDQPTMRRLPRSSTQARYSQPSSVANVRQVGHPRAIDLHPSKRRSRTLAATGFAMRRIGRHSIRVAVDRSQRLPQQASAAPAHGRRHALLAQRRERCAAAHSFAVLARASPPLAHPAPHWPFARALGGASPLQIARARHLQAAGTSALTA